MSERIPLNDKQTAKARKGIVSEIKKLKQTWRGLKREQTIKWTSRHSRKPKKKQKKKKIFEIDDHLKHRKYIKIHKKWEHESIAISNYSMETIVEFYDFENGQNELFKSSDFELSHCLMDKSENNSIRTVFVYIILNQTEQSLTCLITKNVNKWTVENVFEYFEFISNQKYKSFAIQLKKRQIDGTKLLKYDRKMIRAHFINYTDSLLRKEIFDEIQTLKRLYQTKTKDSKSKNMKEVKVKNLIKARKRSKKLGPRDIGKNTHYKAISYSLTQNEFGNFLKERVHPTSNYSNFQKRKELNPLSKHKTMKEIGINHEFESPHYQINDENNDFLSDRVHPYANDQQFQKRKLLSPISSKETLEQIGDNLHYKGINYRLTQTQIGNFLDDRINAYHKLKEFEKRKLQNPVERNQTIEEIGNNEDYKGTDDEYSLRLSVGFLNESIHPLSTNKSFEKRKLANPWHVKETVEQIGDNMNYDGIKHSVHLSPGFLNESIHPLSSTLRFEQRKIQNPILSNETIEAIGDNAHYKEISYELRKSDLSGGDFLKDRINPKAKIEAFEERKFKNPIDKKKTVQEIGQNEFYQSPQWKLEDVIDGDVYFLDDSAYYKARTKMISDLNGVVEPKLGPIDIGKMTEYESVSYDMNEDEKMKSFLNERAWYDSSKVSDKSLSWLLKNLPAYKLKIMDEQILPTGIKTKIVWLKKLRDLVVDELQKRKETKNIAYCAELKAQLSNLNHLIVEMQDSE